MAESNKALLLGGLGLAGYALYQLSQKPAPPPPGLTCPPGQHLAGGVCVADALPPPDPNPLPATGYRVTATAGLIVRAGPGTGYASRGALPYGTIVTIDCQTQGERIGTSPVWDRILGPIAGYVADWWISTPNVGTYSPGLGVCPGGVAIVPPGLPPTGKAALNSIGQVIARMIVSTGCGWGDADYIVLAAKSGYTPRFGKVWIQDKYTWDGLGAPRSAINIVTPGLLSQLGSAGTVRRLTIRNYGEGWIWDGINILGQTPWDTAMQPVNRGPFAVLKSPAGWC